MGLYKYYPEPSGRMGLLWTLALVRDAAIVEFGAMGHMIYAEKWLQQTGIKNRGRIYSTHIDEKDIALGITARLEEAVEEIIKKASPKAIFLLPSSIPEVIGIDLRAIAEEIQFNNQDVPIIALKKGGFKESYSEGVEEAFLTLVKHIVKGKQKSQELTYNIIGSCADINRFQSDVLEIKRLMKGTFSMNCNAVLTSDTSIEEIESMSSSHINILLRREGVKAAKELENRFNIPYIYGIPYGYEGTSNWLKAIEKLLEVELNEQFIEEEIAEGDYVYNYCKQMVKFSSEKAVISIGGNIDVVKGISAFACDELGMKKGFLWCDSKAYSTAEIPYWGEELWTKNIIKDFNGILMSKKEILNHAERTDEFIISRGVDCWNFNQYASPFIGFRGAMKLCSLWLKYLLGDK